MLTLTSVAAALRRGEISSTELVQSLLDRADATEELGAYLSRFDERALAAASRADADFRAGIDRGPLQGVPIGVKDNIFTEDGPTTAQSRVDDPAFRSEQDATVVARLRAAGAVIMGKLTLSEFAIGTPDPISPFPRPRNPWDLGCWPGGSSAGTGVAVSAGLVLAGLGSDTAGSIRIPSALCGITGFKPTYGRVPVTGSIPLAESLDHIGPMARSARDCAAVLTVIAGADGIDRSASNSPLADYLSGLSAPVTGVRIGVVDPSNLSSEVTDEVTDAFDVAVRELAALGMSTTAVELPYYQSTSAAGRIILAAEAFALHRRTLSARWKDYSVSTRLRLTPGAWCTSADLLLAQRQLRLTRTGLAGVFGSVDVVVMPTLGMGAPRFGANETLGRAAVGATGNTIYASATGYPALAMPMGFTVEGLPLSIQVIGRPGQDELVLRVAAAYQDVSDWHLAVPAMRPAVAPSTTEAVLPPARASEAATAADRAAAEVFLNRAGIDAGPDLGPLADAFAQHIEQLRLIGAGVG